MTTLYNSSMPHLNLSLPNSLCFAASYYLIVDFTLTLHSSTCKRISFCSHLGTCQRGCLSLMNNFPFECVMEEKYIPKIGHRTPYVITQSRHFFLTYSVYILKTWMFHKIRRNFSWAVWNVCITFHWLCSMSSFDDMVYEIWHILVVVWHSVLKLEVVAQLCSSVFISFFPPFRVRQNGSN